MCNGSETTSEFSCLASPEAKHFPCQPLQPSHSGFFYAFNFIEEITEAWGGECVCQRNYRALNRQKSQD